MIDGVRFIAENYPRASNTNDAAVYRALYHPDALWCPPHFEDKRGVDQIAFAYAFKDFTIDASVLELEGIDGETQSYVTGLLSVKTYDRSGSFRKEMLLRGSWVIVLYRDRPVIRYQVWNEKRM